SSPQQIYGIRSTTYPSYALNLAQLGALCISNLCATKPIYTNLYRNNYKYLEPLRQNTLNSSKAYFHNLKVERLPFC
ncbi:hypothetical protein ACLDXR_10310, partial [Acinetobacter baumannii]